MAYAPPRVEASASPPAPVDAASRITAIDTLRGFALLGILLLNIQAFAMPGAAYVNPTAWGDLTGLNWFVWAASHLLADQKMMAIFSMLFGAGIVLFTGRVEARGGRPVALFLRRTGWLLVAGLMHAYLLWSGDILFLYAVCGFVAVWFRNWPPRRLLVLAFATLAVSSAIYFGFGATFEQWPAEQRAEFIEEAWSPAPERLAEEVAAYRGGWIEQMGQRVPAALVMQTFLFAIWGFWRAAGMMFLGMALFKLGVLGAERSDRFYARLVALGAFVGMPLVAYGIYRNVATEWGPLSLFHGSQWNYWGSVAASLGWIGAVMLAHRHRILTGLQLRLAAVGRTAFSNYLFQTLICTTIFYGHGFGLFGQVERVGQLGIVAAVWIVQLVGSPIWLRHFRSGPVEWLWRSLTYGERQPFRSRV